MSEETSKGSWYIYGCRMSSNFNNWDPPGVEGAPGADATSHDTPFWGFSTTGGVKNPFWKDQIRHGQDATTSFSGVRYDGNADWFTSEWRYTYEPNTSYENMSTSSGRKGSSGGFINYPYYPSAFGADPSATASARNRAIATFLSSCQSARSSFEAGQDLGEYKETLHAIHKPLNSLSQKLSSYANALMKAKGKYKGNVPSLKKVLADTYLEFRFGWDPLAADVATAIADAGRYRFSTIPVHGSGHIVTAADTNSYPVSAGAYVLGGATCKAQTRTSYSCRIRGSIRSGSNGSGQISKQQAWQLLPRNFLPTAWDLLPYSWVVDYFTNVGDIIGALSFVFSDLVYCCQTTRRESTATYSEVAINPNGVTLPANYHWLDHKVTSFGGNANFSVTYVDRVKLLAGSLVPSFSFEIPRSPYPFLNLAAVAVTRFKKLSPFF